MSRERENDGCLIALWMIAVLMVGFILIGLGACRSVKYVPVVEKHTEYVSHTDSIIHKDTLEIREQTIIREVDSATMAMYGIELKNMRSAWLIQTSRLQKQISDLQSAKRDTFYREDTIRVPVPVERKLTKAERTYITIGKWSVGAVAGLVLAAICFIFKRRWKFSS